MNSYHISAYVHYFWFNHFNLNKLPQHKHAASLFSLTAQYIASSTLRTCILRSHPGPCLTVTWQTRQKTARKKPKTKHCLKPCILQTCIESSDWLLRCFLLAKSTYLLCCLYPVTLHVKHLETLEQDVFCWSGHSRCEGGLQGPRRKATQVLNGQLQNIAGLSVSTLIKPLALWC